VSVFASWSKPVCLEKYQGEFCRVGDRCLWKPSLILVDATEELEEKFRNMDRRSFLKAAYCQEIIGVFPCPTKSSLTLAYAMEEAERIVNNLSESEVKEVFARRGDRAGAIASLMAKVLVH